MNYRDLESLCQEGQDIIDTRDIEARIRELESERDDWDAEGNTEGPGLWPDANPDEAEELAKLKTLREELASSEWSDGITLIADSYFETYARQFADDIGRISGDEDWPYTCIDWKQAARELQHDFSSVEYGSTTYWYQG